MEHCLKEKEWGLLEGTLKSLEDSQERIEKKVCSHIYEGEKEGGHRDILRDLVKEVRHQGDIISTIKKGYWKSGMIGGVIVYVLIKLPEVGQILLGLLSKFVFAGQ